MITMREIAEEVGCSIATVSRALNGGARVDDSTSEAIKAASKRLGYQSKRAAQKLDGHGATRTIGLLIPTLEKFNYTLSMSLMQKVLAQADYRLLLSCHGEDPEAEKSLLLSLINHPVDAIVHVPSGPDGAATLLGEELRIPIVEFYRKSQDPNVEAVVADDELGSYELVRHLVEHGHQRIALVADDKSHSSSISRAEGFTRAISESELSASECPMLFRPELEFTRARDWGQTALEQIHRMGDDIRPTAVLCTSTHVALGVVEGCRHLGIDIPVEMSIVAFSSAEWLDICDPPLTRYQNPLKEMGLMAAQLLLNRLDLPPETDLAPSSVRFAGKLMVRNSVAEPKGVSIRRLG